jgi:hypothetical protein
MYKEYKGLLGPFQNPTEVSKHWYKVEEEHLEDEIERYRETIRERKIELKKNNLPEEGRKNIEDFIQDDSESLKFYQEKLNELDDFIGDYLRGIERFKYKRRKLKQIEHELKEFNFSLYDDYCDFWFGYYGGYDNLSREDIKERESKRKRGKIKREEIAKRMKDWLS